MVYNDIVVRGMNKKRRLDFRAHCIVNGYTISDAIRWLVDQVVDGKIKLPQKGEK